MDFCTVAYCRMLAIGADDFPVFVVCRRKRRRIFGDPELVVTGGIFATDDTRRHTALRNTDIRFKPRILNIDQIFAMYRTIHNGRITTIYNFQYVNSIDLTSDTMTLQHEGIACRYSKQALACYLQLTGFFSITRQSGILKG